MDFAPEVAIEGLGLPQWGLDIKVAWLFGSQGPQRNQVSEEASGNTCRWYGSIRIIL